MSEPPTSRPDQRSTALAGDGVAAQVYRRIHGTALPDVARAKEAPSEGERSRHRRVVSALPPRNHLLPVPNGWYSILASEDLEEGDLVSIRAVDRELVVWRDGQGEARVLDAHCAHLGAHLGGGRVAGACVKCPYHGWEYSGDGRCVRIPYSEARIPARARVRSYQVHEASGIVFFWYHAADATPNFDVPAVPEASDPAWSGPHIFETELVAALQEMAENNVDYAHFRYVHGRDAVPVDISELHLDGPCSRVEESLGDGMSFSRHSYGPGIAVLRFPALMTILATTTPIDRGNCRLLWHFYFPKDVEDAAGDLMLSVTGPYGLQADVPIWRDMQYRERPVLVKGDGPIAEYRRWYQQFYEGSQREGD